MTRIQDEIQVSLNQGDWHLKASNRGAVLISLKIGENSILRDLPDLETEPGSKGGLFCAPQIFARIQDRALTFKGKHHNFTYPEDIIAKEVDPHCLYIHGLNHYYTWDIQSQSDSSVTFCLPKERLPKEYPFPHTSLVTYSIENNELLISVSLTETKAPTPAMLTIHPFFRFYFEGDHTPPKFKCDLTHKFDYPVVADIPMSFDAPITKFSEQSFSTLKPLPKNLDHSFLSKDGVSEIHWPNGVAIRMLDETSDETCSFKPVQIWTTAADSRNAFGIEQGGPANLIYLAENELVDAALLPVVAPGEIKTRKVRYQIIK